MGRPKGFFKWAQIKNTGFFLSFFKFSAKKIPFKFKNSAINPKYIFMYTIITQMAVKSK